MHNSAIYFRRANDLLKEINLEKVHLVRKATLKLIQIRKYTSEMAESSGMKAPALTACVTTTLLGYGLCQELCQRFVLEYVLKYKRQDISLIFMSNPKQGHTKEDHLLVYIGNIKVPEELIIGKGSSDTIIEPEKINQNLDEFLQNQNDGIFADPLLNCAGFSKEEIFPLTTYCERYNLTHIIAVRSYHRTPLFLESAEEIKTNAKKIAQVIEESYLLPTIEKKVGFFKGDKHINSGTSIKSPNFEGKISQLYKSLALEDNEKGNIQKELDVLKKDAENILIFQQKLAQLYKSLHITEEKKEEIKKEIMSLRQ